jgi:hypothetical protein
LVSELLHLNKKRIRRGGFLSSFAGQDGADEMRLGCEYGVLPGSESVGPGEPDIYEENSIKHQFHRFVQVMPGSTAHAEETTVPKLIVGWGSYVRVVAIPMSVSSHQTFGIGKDGVPE